MLFFMSLMLITNSLFIYLSHPLSMGMMLIIQTLIIAFFSSMFMPSFWFSYILILIFMGGLLVLFVYVATLASNEQANMTSPHIVSIAGMLSLIFMVTTFNSSKTFMLTDNFKNEETFSWMFTTPMMNLSIFLIMYLFMALVAIVKITKFWGGALRPAN